MDLTYLASPYSSPDPAVRDARCRAACRHAALLFRRGEYVFAPIPHTHPIAMAGALPTGFEFWRGYDEVMMRACTKVVVLMLDGWKESKGVQAEIAIAKSLGLPIRYDVLESDA